VDDGGVGRMARSTARPYRSQPWAQQRGADGAQVRDGSDDSARAQAARARCPRHRATGAREMPGGGVPAGVYSC